MSGAHKISWWGALDPYTFGVWISEDKIHDFPEPDRFDPLFLTSLLIRPGDVHRAFIESLDDDLRVTAWTGFSAYAHEWRHWFDATSSPFGMVRAVQLAAFYATAVSIEDRLDVQQRIHVPLKRWVKSPKLIALAEPDLGELDPEIAAILGRAMLVLGKADRALLARANVMGTDVATTQILEGLAMLEQERLLDEVFGPDAVAGLRTSIRLTNGGPAYYHAIDLVEGQTGLSRPGTTSLLEGTLFANYGVYGSVGGIAPAELLATFLSEGHWTSDETVPAEVDRLLLGVNGYGRVAAHEASYVVAVRTLEQMLGGAAQDPDGSSAKRVRTAVPEALLDAFRWSGAARFRDVYGAEVGDADLPEPDPYALPAPLFVEGYPGRYGPEDPAIQTLAGWTVPLADMQSAFPWWTFPKAILETPAIPRVQSIVWTPVPDGPAPGYFKIFDAFWDLMFWQGILFGPGAISPYTFWATTLAEAEARGLTLVGPQVPSSGGPSV